MTDFDKPDDAAVPPPPPPAVSAAPEQPGQVPPPYPPPPGHPGPPPGYGAYPPPPRRSPTSIAMWAHLGAFLALAVGGSVCCVGPLLSWVAPVVIRNDSQNRHDPFIRHHATQALNHAITQAIAVVLAVALYIAVVISLAVQDGSGNLAFPFTLAGLLVVLALYVIAGLVFAIIGTTKANGGQWWSYPKFFAIPFVKEQ